MAGWNTALQRNILGIAVLATFIAFLDGSVVNVALPAIGRDLGGGLPAQQWVVDAYLLTLGAVILLAGSLSDLFGRKRVLFWGLVGFGIASALCALAPTAVFLILARGLQGIAGALLVPSSLALILGAFQGPAQSRAIGVWTAITSLASIAGPILGGGERRNPSGLGSSGHRGRAGQHECEIAQQSAHSQGAPPVAARRALCRRLTCY